jgi:hypothetical protein
MKTDAQTWSDLYAPILCNLCKQRIDSDNGRQPIRRQETETQLQMLLLTCGKNRNIKWTYV